MHTILPLALTNAAAAAAAAAAVGGQSPAPATTAFGGPSPVHIVRIGHIETDLEKSDRGTLRPVPCAVARPGATLCFVAASSPPQP